MTDRLTWPRRIAVVAALIAIVAFFLPYISATDDYRERMQYFADDKLIDGVDITVGEMMDLSLFKYARVYQQGGDALLHSSGSGMIYTVLYSAVPVFAVLILLAALRKRPILTLLCDLLMGGTIWIINWDFADRGIMPDSDRLWAIAYYLYYPLAAIIAICTIWMFIEKRKTKKGV